MKYEDVNIDVIEKAVKEVFLGEVEEERRVKIITNIYGYDMFNEAMEEIGLGMKRQYIGWKVPRFLRKLNFKIHKSVIGKYYKLIKINAEG